jgi:hypothetical protein
MLKAEKIRGSVSQGTLMNAASKMDAGSNMKPTASGGGPAKITRF